MSTKSPYGYAVLFTEQYNCVIYLFNQWSFILQFVPNESASQPTQNSTRSEDSKKKILRIQDKELKEMSDDGMCLSMHQPWASLLVAGIKK